MSRFFLSCGAASAAVAVSLGALAAHALKGRIDPRMLDAFEVGVRYQMYHALGLIAVAWVVSRTPGAVAAAAGWLLIAGTAMFSGSLYGLALGGPRWLGPITPLGGLSFMAGWLCLAAAGWRGAARPGPGGPPTGGTSHER